ncbi:predicted protein [Chaetoceros tenuissimus]|uniref:MYND-type domain-containing protein n=1 Tax=Chaetoceros tenuissimus TaxID=426638 RepID=A0AAD3CXN3_9STRA|nr:predicted protein [Chaetoceros tenuissimus]
MGKKGKRIKQKGGRKEAGKILRETYKLMEGADNDVRDGLYSKGANQYREVIRILESKKNLMVYTLGQQSTACVLVMNAEYQRRNYKAALDCYNYFMTKSKSDTSKFGEAFSSLGDTASLYHQLIMLRLNGQECQLSDFLHSISLEGNATSLKGNTAAIMCMEAVFAFRAHKQFDSAIRLEMACGSLRWNPFKHWNPFKGNMSLALTYLEQHRVEFHQRSEMREEDFSTMRSLITPIQTEYPIEHNMSFTYCLIVAQWYYLTHTLLSDKEKREQLINAASSMVEGCLECASPLLPYSRPSENKCYTCGQAATPTEVQYVCSGCRVACYCSIDHQRMTWKKEAVKGMRIGHEILCPLYKAHRKYTEARKSGDKEKESRMKSRLERECVTFLEYGLGLKNKCFPCEYQERYTIEALRRNIISG